VGIDAYEAEAGEAVLTVVGLPGELLEASCTAREASNASVGTSRLYLARDCLTITSQRTARALEVGTFTEQQRGTFVYHRFYSATPPYQPAAPHPSPARMTKLFVLPYPLPYSGAYATTSEPLCAQLSAAWAAPFNACDSSAYVLKLENGTCPLGASPVYQAFHRARVSHRYTQSAETYAMLVASAGYAGEGAVWCALSKP